MAVAKTTAAAPEQAVETKYTKEQIVRAKTYSRYRDMLSAALDGERTYSKTEIEKTIKNGGAE